MSTHLIHPDADELREILERTWPDFSHVPGTIVNESGGGAPAAAVGADGAAGGVGGMEGGEGGEEGEGGEPPAPLTQEAFDQRFAELRDDLMASVQGEPGEPGYGQPGEQGYEYGDPQQPGEPDYGDLASQFIENIQQNGGEITAQDLQQFAQLSGQAAAQQALQEALPQALEQALEPIHGRFLQQDADKLEERYPTLSDPQQQQAIVREAVQTAQMMGDVELARNPGFIEMVYLAKCAREGTAAVPASGNDATLEAAAAAQAGGQQEGPSLPQQIVDAGGTEGDLFGPAFG